MTNEITLHHISVSEMDNNCYLLAANGEGLLIDAADALILTYPDFAALDGLPDDIRGEATLPDSTSWPTT